MSKYAVKAEPKNPEPVLKNEAFNSFWKIVNWYFIKYYNGEYRAGGSRLLQTYWIAVSVVYYFAKAVSKGQLWRTKTILRMTDNGKIGISSLSGMIQESNEIF